MNTDVLFGSPAAGFPLPAALHSALGGCSSQCALRLGFPFVSRSGVEVLVSGLSHSGAWGNARKDWLVGVSQGITEPAALEQVAALQNSRVRIYTPTGEISVKSLRSRPMFHAKVVGVRHNERLHSLLVSSANLTRAAIGGGNANFEAGMCVVSPPRNVERDWNNWWRSAWGVGLPLSKTIIDKYARAREKFVRENPVVLEALDLPSHASLSSASALWIEAGAMSGGSRNQVEFSRDLAGFFGNVQSKQRLLELRVGSRRWDDRPLSPKVTTFGVEIWRLSLPTLSSGGFDYPGKVIRFRRVPTGKAEFLLDVAEPNSGAARSWRSQANRDGYISVTSGKRAFGLY